MAGTVRAPRAYLNALGSKINLISCEVERGALQTDHKFEAVMALDDLTTPDPDIWASTAPIPASVSGTNGDGTSGEVVLIDGWCDKVIIDFDTRIVTVYGSDVTANMIGTFNDQKEVNQPTTTVAANIAAKHGCGFKGGGSGKVAGRTFDGQEYAHNSQAESDWDVIQSCAQQDGVTAFVDNNTLYYGTQGSGDFMVNYTPPTFETYETGNFMKLRCERDIQISAGVDVTAATWNTRDKKFYVAKSAAQPRGGG